MAEFDTVKFLDTLLGTITTISKSMVIDMGSSTPPVAELCSTVRAARLEVKKDILDENSHGKYGETNPLCFTNENYDPENFYVVQHIGTEFVFADYYFYQYKGDTPFTEEEKKAMTFIAHLIYYVASSSILSRHMKFARDHELRFKNIYNAFFFHITVSKLIAQDRIDDYSVILFNIHGFSQINKKIGDKAGTELIERYHNGIISILGEDQDPDKNGFLSSFGGDTGAIVFKKHLKDELLAYLSSVEFSLITDKGNEEILVLYSHCGLNTDLEGYDSPRKILDSVSLPLNIARKTPGVKCIEYDETFKKKFEMQQKVESWYKDALRDEEFLVYYQPKVELKQYKLFGAEALVRWVHKEIMVYPDQFIPVLENNLSIKYLDLYMLNHVCADIKRWIAEGKEVPQVSVNLSRATLNMNNLVDIITTTIDKYGIPRRLIQIELTESASDAANEELRPLVEGLNREGISTAVDDFGTGFSSLSLIKELPWDVIKIDKSLLKGAQKDGSRDQLMFKAIIAMANTLGLECIVEGVETKEDVRILKESGCFMAQGYYFSKPKSKEEFESILAKTE